MVSFDCGITIDEKYKCLLFDLDGTLVDNMQMHIEAWVDTGVKYGVPITEAQINANTGIPTRQLIEKLSTENQWSVDYQAFTLAKQDRYREIKANSGKIKVIEPILQIARHYKGVLPMGIGTGSSRRNAISALEDAGIIDWFGAIITADDVDHPKPHPEVYVKGATILGVDPTTCLVFEDGEKGMQSAVAAGMDFIDVRPHV